MTGSARSPADIAARVRAAWAAHLGHTRFTDDDDFFVVGGHSVLAAHVVAHLGRDLGVRLPVRMFLDNVTVREFSEAIAAHVGGGPEMTRP